MHLACCGPTFPISWALLAVIWKSAISPDSIPKGFLQLPEIQIIREHVKYYDYKTQTHLSRQRLRRLHMLSLETMGIWSVPF